MFARLTAVEYLLVPSCNTMCLSWPHRQGCSLSHFFFRRPQGSQLRRIPEEVGFSLPGFGSSSSPSTLFHVGCAVGLEVSIAPFAGLFKTLHCLPIAALGNLVRDPKQCLQGEEGGEGGGEAGTRQQRRKRSGERGAAELNQKAASNK